jgi:hypothetical protein
MTKLRHAVEHWNQPDGGSQKWLTDNDGDPNGHSWQMSGSGVLGGLISDDALEAWGRSVYADVLAIDIWQAPEP